MGNMEQVACDFYDWLVQMGYRDIEDELEDLDLVIKDFEAAYKVAPRLINLLREISK